MAAYYTITPEIYTLSEKCIKNGEIDSSLYAKHQVKRGLRDLDGRGVVTGLTEISTIISSKEINGEHIPAPGELYYRGINIKDIVSGLKKRCTFCCSEVFLTRGSLMILPSFW